MGRGTPCFGKRHQKTHTLCRRCGRMSYHKQKGTCSACGYPAARLRKCKFLHIQTAGLSKRKTGRARELDALDISKPSLAFTKTKLRAETDSSCFIIALLHYRTIDGFSCAGKTELRIRAFYDSYEISYLHHFTFMTASLIARAT